MKIRFYTLILLFGWVQDQVHGSCSTQNMDRDKVIQFCSGSNITGDTIILSTEEASTRKSNCTCHFSVTLKTIVYVTGNCTANIYRNFLGSTRVTNDSVDFTQHMEATEVLQLLYINDYNSEESCCKQFKPKTGNLEWTCFADSSTQRPETSSMRTTMVLTLPSTTDHSTRDKNKNITTKGITTASTKGTTASTITPTPVSTLATIAASAITITPVSTITTTHVYYSTTYGSTTVTFKNKHKENNLVLVIIISLSVVAIASTLVITTVAFCLRNRRLKKQENARSRSAASNPSFNQADDSGDEMVYNELYHSRNVNRGHVVSAFSNYENVTPYGPAPVVSNDSGIQSQNGNPSVCAVSLETHNQNEVKKNGEPIYAVPDKKKKKNKEGNASSYVYAQPERKKKEKRPVTKTRPEKETTQEKETRPEKETRSEKETRLEKETHSEKETRPAAATEDFEFDFTNNEENSMHW